MNQIRNFHKIPVLRLRLGIRTIIVPLEVQVWKINTDTLNNA